MGNFLAKAIESGVVVAFKVEVSSRDKRYILLIDILMYMLQPDV